MTENTKKASKPWWLIFAIAALAIIAIFALKQKPAATAPTASAQKTTATLANHNAAAHTTSNETQALTVSAAAKKSITPTGKSQYTAANHWSGHDNDSSKVSVKAHAAGNQSNKNAQSSKHTQDPKSTHAAGSKSNKNAQKPEHTQGIK
ncbi:MAG: hypothetical protein K0U29_01730 [Gammaproteobacteria bacterium]|nr:hypothetical protein [Gammaproteobacteria bacterium]MCH9743629.1 hypothetical protein [Gammaproteobacteria bacterium]